MERLIAVIAYDVMDPEVRGALYRLGVKYNKSDGAREVVDASSRFDKTVAWNGVTVHAREVIGCVAYTKRTAPVKRLWVRFGDEPPA